MIDPDFYEDVDPDFFFDTAGEEAEIDAAYQEEYVFDTYDEIIDEDVLGFNDIDPDLDENNYDWDIDGAEMGLMGALAAEMSEESRRYDVDENTDRENWKRAVEAPTYTSRQQQRSNLRPFEQYVQDYIKRGCRHPDD